MALPSRQTLLNLGETLLIGTIGGAILTLAGIPAGWLSGAMIAVAIAALAGRPMAIPAPLARVVFVLIGISLGGAVTPETLKGVATWPLSVVLLCVGMTCAMFGSAVYLKKVHGWDMLSGLFGSAPGALSQVMAYATQYHSDLRGIAIVQTIRVVILTACLPVALAMFGMIPAAPVSRSFAISDSVLEIAILVLVSTAAAMLAHFVRFPGGLIFGAMLASAILHGYRADPCSDAVVGRQRGDGVSRLTDRGALCQYRAAAAAQAPCRGAWLVFGRGADRCSVRRRRGLGREP